MLSLHLGLGGSQQEWQNNPSIRWPAPGRHELVDAAAAALDARCLQMLAQTGFFGRSRSQMHVTGVGCSSDLSRNTAPKAHKCTLCESVSVSSAPLCALSFFGHPLRLSSSSGPPRFCILVALHRSLSNIFARKTIACAGTVLVLKVALFRRVGRLIFRSVEDLGWERRGTCGSTTKACCGDLHISLETSCRNTASWRGGRKLHGPPEGGFGRARVVSACHT